MRLSTVAADIIVLIVTWMATFKHTRDAIRVGTSAKLSKTLLRDGKATFLSLTRRFVLIER